MSTNNEDKLILGGHEFTSRFILGSGKFSLDLVKACIEKADAQIITLAGGVTVTIEDDFSKVDKTMKQGETITLTDEQAVHFIHDRFDVGDESNTQRMKRQEVYKAGLKDNLAAKCSEDNTYPLTIYDALGDYMVTDISSQKFSKLALLVLKEKDAGTVSIAGTETVDDLGFVEVEPDADSLQQAIVELFYKEYN